MNPHNTYAYRNVLVSVVMILTFMSSTLIAQVGTPDLTFNGTGKKVYDKDNVDLYQDVKVLPDGKIIATGTYYSPTFSSGIEVTRYLADGNFDVSFGTGGHYNLELNIEMGAYASIIKENGKIVIGGYTTDYTTWSMLLIQLNADGTPDQDFGTGGMVILDPGPGEDIIYALTADSGGMILAAGYSQNNSFQNEPVVMRFSETGILDTSFGTDGFAKVPVTETDNDFSAVCVQSDGKIVAAGHISNGLNWFSLLIARYDENGNIDPSYGTDGIVNLNLGNVDDEFFDMRMTSSDEAILSGFSVTQSDLYYHMLLMKFDNTGQPDSSFGTNGAVIAGEVPYSIGSALILQTDGKIVIAGSTGNLAPDNNDWAIWRYQANGTVDQEFGTNGLVVTDFFGNPDEALGIDLYQDKIIVAGKTRNQDNRLDFAVARYNNDVGVFLNDPVDVSRVSVTPNPVARNRQVNIGYTLSEAGDYKIRFMNTAGVAVYETILRDQAVGSHSSVLDLPSGITAGVYYIVISGSQSHFVRKLVVI